MPDMEKPPQEQVAEKAYKKPEGKKETPEVSGDSGEANKAKLAELQEYVTTIQGDLEKARADDNSEVIQELTAELAGVQDQIKAEEENMAKLNVEIAAPAEAVAPEKKAEVAESPAEKLQRELGTMATETSKFVGQINETPYDKLEATQEMIDGLKSQREIILAQGLAYMESRVAQGEDIAKDMDQLNQIVSDIDDAEGTLVNKMSGQDERGFGADKTKKAALETRTEHGANEVAQLLKMVELTAKSVSARAGEGTDRADSLRVKVDILADMAKGKFGWHMPKSMSPEGVQVFQKAIENIEKDPKYKDVVRDLDQMKGVKLMLGYKKGDAEKRRGQA